MKISIGHAVEGDNFFGREKELQRIAETWQNKAAGIFIPGPRRIGKTSLVKEFIRRNNEYKFVYFDLEGRYSIVELCKDLMKEIDSTFPQFIKSKGDFSKKWNKIHKMVSEIEIGKFIKVKTGELTETLKEMTDKMEDIFTELYRENFIIAFDEFSDFLLNLKKNSLDEVKFFLEWMRRLRQQGKIRMIITGSINIISTIEELNFPYLINDMTDVEILPLETGEVRALLAGLLKDKNITLGVKAADLAAEKLNDGIPFYIQLFADGLAFYTGGDRSIDDPGEIKQLYERITGKQHKEFIDFHTRLKTHLPSQGEYDAARKILAHTSRNPMSFDDLYPYIETILPEKTAVNKLLKRLSDECYLKKEAGSYGFVSTMLADWWKNHYEWER
ncbi:MAG TPA: ATP-binding protein [Candidatus Kapabacteria bacterium]|nr:ATP-binding protein [Candidatus Kapabacteria bacterium]